MTEYNKWLEYQGMPNDLLEELKNMEQDKIDEVFACNLEFGTAGIRGLLGAGTNRLNIFTVQRATLGLAKYLINNYEEYSERLFEHFIQHNTTIKLAEYFIKEMEEAQK